MANPPASSPIHSEGKGGGQGEKNGSPLTGGTLVLTLDDVLTRVPTRSLKPGLHDPTSELHFGMEELLDGISRGRATVMLSKLAERYPETFAGPAPGAEDTPIYLPLQKLIQQIGRATRRAPEKMVMPPPPPTAAAPTPNPAPVASAPKPAAAAPPPVKVEPVVAAPEPEPAKPLRKLRVISEPVDVEMQSLPPEPAKPAATAKPAELPAVKVTIPIFQRAAPTATAPAPVPAPAAAKPVEPAPAPLRQTFVPFAPPTEAPRSGGGSPPQAPPGQAAASSSAQPAPVPAQKAVAPVVVPPPAKAPEASPGSSAPPTRRASSTPPPGHGGEPPSLLGATVPQTPLRQTPSPSTPAPVEHKPATPPPAVEPKPAPEPVAPPVAAKEPVLAPAPVVPPVTAKEPVLAPTPAPVVEAKPIAQPPPLPPRAPVEVKAPPVAEPKPSPASVAPPPSPEIPQISMLHTAEAPMRPPTGRPVVRPPSIQGPAGLAAPEAPPLSSPPVPGFVFAPRPTGRLSDFDPASLPSEAEMPEVHMPPLFPLHSSPSTEVRPPAPVTVELLPEPERPDPAVAEVAELRRHGFEAPSASELPIEQDATPSTEAPSESVAEPVEEIAERIHSTEARNETPPPVEDSLAGAEPVSEAAPPEAPSVVEALSPLASVADVEPVGEGATSDAPNVEAAPQGTTELFGAPTDDVDTPLAAPTATAFVEPARVDPAFVEPPPAPVEPPSAKVPAPPIDHPPPPAPAVPSPAPEPTPVQAAAPSASEATRSEEAESTPEPTAPSSRGEPEPAERQISHAQRVEGLVRYDLFNAHFSLARIDQEPLQAIFMTEEFLDLARVSQLSCSFPGITGCMIVAGDAVSHSGERPAGFDATGICQLTRQLSTVAVKYPEQLPAVQTYTFHVGTRALSIFSRTHVALCLVHSPRGFLPGVRERLSAVADTLSRGITGESEPS